MSANNLNVNGERELRYIVQWFDEWSELQREDFLPIVVEYLTKDRGAHYMNGVVNSLSAASFDEKPMSLFQCRVKLFKEWCAKWPEDYKIKLKEKICEIDAAFGEKLNQEILNGYSNGNGTSSPTDQAIPIAELQNEAIVA